MNDLRLMPRLADLAGVFLKVGTFGFGGPAAHLALLEDEVVSRRAWLTRETFLDLVGATHLIPGPNSTEMAIHIGYLRAGWLGLLVAGSCFILPATLITAGLACLYVEYGSLPDVQPFLAGINPAVLGVIFVAVWRLGKSAARTWRRAGVGVAVALAVLFEVDQVLALFAGGIGGMFLLVQLRDRPRPRGGKLTLLLAGLLAASKSRLALAASSTAAGAALVSEVSIWQLGLFFLKVGAALYGGGYVLVAYLEGGLVDEWGLLERTQLLDAIAIGQFTPGPILSTATFIGYLVHGPPGAVVATVGIFLPSFVFVLLLRPILPRLREGAWTAAFLDAVNVSAVGLMAVAILNLGRGALEGPAAWVIALLAVLVLLRWKVSSTWVILGGALAGWTVSLLG